MNTEECYSRGWSPNASTACGKCLDKGSCKSLTLADGGKGNEFKGKREPVLKGGKVAAPKAAKAPVKSKPTTAPAPVKEKVKKASTGADTATRKGTFKTQQEGTAPKEVGKGVQKDKKPLTGDPKPPSTHGNLKSLAVQVCIEGKGNTEDIYQIIKDWKKYEGKPESYVRLRASQTRYNLKREGMV